MMLYRWIKKITGLGSIAIFIMVAAMTAGAVGTVTGSIKTARDDGKSPSPGKYATIAFYHAETGEQLKTGEQTVEDGTVATPDVGFHFRLLPGTYHMVVRKAGYLDYTVREIDVTGNSDIILPEIHLIPGDLNGDGVIDINDLIISLRAFDLSGSFDLIRQLSDLNEDGVAGVYDYGLIKSANVYGKTQNDSVLQYSSAYDNPRVYENETSDAVYLIDALTMNIGKNGLTSGWDYDNRYEILNQTGAVTPNIHDLSVESELFLRRIITPRHTGTMTLEITATLTRAESGAFFVLTDGEGTDTFRIYTKNGWFHAKGETDTALPYQYQDGSYKIKLVTDLDTRTAQIYINGVNCGAADMSIASEGIDRFIIGTAKEDTPTIVPSRVQLYINYLVNEIFYMSSVNTMPDDWEVTGGIKINTIISTGCSDPNSAYVSAAAGSSHVAKKSFDPVSGNVIFESYMLLPNGADGAYVSLNSGDTEAVRLYTAQKSFRKGTGEHLRDFTSNIWQCLRIEANTETQSAVIRINGKTTGTFAFDNEVSSFDNIRIGFSPSSAATMWFDDVKVFRYDEPDDYVPAPVPANAQGYHVGLNICSLWRNGHHFGWDSISPYEDLEPVLGFYDEGLREVADWEIKIMVENGIDYQHLCWYSPSGNLQSPIKKSRMNDALHDGFFNAKYSDMMKFNFMWENTGQNVSSLEQFKQYLWPYWVEYYFTDPRFMTMDNKPVMTVWSYGKFISAFGSEQGARDAIQFMDSEMKKLGFDGIILLFSDGHQMTKSFFDSVAAVGADGTYGYHWNITGKDAEHQIYRLSTQQGFQSTHIVPTVSVGFNNIGWSGERKDMISLEGHKQVLEYIRDTFLPNYGNANEDWKKRAVIISTWNEYGEGTYVMPAGVHGFGYMNNVREALTTASGAPENLLPTPAQKARLGYLYPAARTLIKPLGYEGRGAEVLPIPTGIVRRWNMSTIPQAAEWSAMFGVANFKNTTGVLSGTGTINDFAVTTSLSSLSLDISQATHIHVTMKTSATGNIEIFYITEQDQSWNGAKKVSLPVTQTGQFVDYIFPIADQEGWTGTLKQLRIDPLDKPANFEISLVQILCPTEEEKPGTVIVNEQEMLFDFPPVIQNGEFYVTANPDFGIFSMLGVFYQYSRFTGSLSLASPEHEIVFQIGSDTATVDGTPVNLGYTVSLRDGLPVLPMKFLLENLGHEYTVEDRTLTAQTIDQEYIDALKNRKPYEYEFNIPGDLEGWRPGSMAAYVGDGVLTGVSIRKSESPYFDPTLSSPDIRFNADLYSTIEIRMKHEYIPVNVRDNVVVYFKTQAEDYMDEKKTARATLRTGSSNGQFVVYELNMAANEYWTGTITGLRFDPFNREGTCVVDYIRVLRNSVPAPPEEEGLTDSLINGDAENTQNVAFFSDNATISIQPDPDVSGNHVYRVMSRTGKNWTYFRQNVKFVPGRTYVIEYDIKITGTNDGSATVSPVDVFINLIYSDSQNDHALFAVKAGTADGWTHVRKEMTVSSGSVDRSFDQFSVFVNPVGDLGVNYLIDNVTMTAK